MELEKAGVIVRFRPINSEENPINSVNILDENTCSLTVDKQVHTFTFDNVYPPSVSQTDFFNGRPIAIINHFLNGGNASIIAYGQTASGKSYTMTGNSSLEQQGIIPRAAKYIYDFYKGEIACSFVEIYNEKVYDLLAGRNPVAVTADGSLKGAKTVVTTSHKEFMQLLFRGNRIRSTGGTKMNSNSSRSHSIVQLYRPDVGCQLSLVDLAGSETVKKSGATGSVLKEASFINTSLCALAMVITALSEDSSSDPNNSGKDSAAATSPAAGTIITTASPPTAGAATGTNTCAASASHIPYRNSKLTHALRKSFEGESCTTVIINCSPSASHANETLSSLRFGERAKKVVKEESHDEVMKEFWRIQNRINAAKHLTNRVLVDGNVPLSEIRKVDPDGKWISHLEEVQPIDPGSRLQSIVQAFVNNSAEYQAMLRELAKKESELAQLNKEGERLTYEAVQEEARLRKRIEARRNGPLATISNNTDRSDDIYAVDTAPIETNAYDFNSSALDRNTIDLSSSAM